MKESYKQESELQREIMKGLSVSYSLMTQNTTAWDHLIKTIEDMKEEVVHKTFDCLSLDDISPNLSGYVRELEIAPLKLGKELTTRCREA